MYDEIYLTYQIFKSIVSSHLIRNPTADPYLEALRNFNTLVGDVLALWKHKELIAIPNWGCALSKGAS